MHAIPHSESGGRDDEVMLAELEGARRYVGGIAAPNGGDPKLVLDLQSLGCESFGVRPNDHFDDLDVTAGKREVVLKLLLDDPLKDDVGGELSTCHVRDVKRPIRLSTARLVESSQGPRDTEYALGEFHRHHVRVVRIGDRHKRVGELDPGFLQQPDVDRSAEVGRSVEGRAKRLEGSGTIVDDRDVVTLVSQVQGQVAANATTAGDDDSRVSPPTRSRPILEV